VKRMNRPCADDVFDILVKYDLLEEDHREVFCKIQT